MLETPFVSSMKVWGAWSVGLGSLAGIFDLRTMEACKFRRAPLSV